VAKKRGKRVAPEAAPEVAPEAAPKATPETPAAGHGGLVRVGPAGAAVWLDEALASALTDKDRKRLNKVVKRVLKRAKKR
jgi:hypothetical protein